ncbi:hypothetical protein Hypma_008192 [Hypsizygus marmoreus]|uniref:Cell wall protein phiA n=1 Tax=Hypsizygus marmoreus TaxID=39966 RepID=A0A369JT97_HYPMA|nr:hypothetical protein Hypma_008192 [Hypsizygus marmoreus]
MLFTTFITIATALTITYTHAAAVGECVTVRRGYLAANVSDTFKSFTLNKAGQLAYTGDGKKPLKVEFRHCPVLDQPGGDPSIDTPGQVYIPAHKKCLAITNQPDAEGPYHTALEECATTWPFVFVMRDVPDIGESVYWIGSTDVEGTMPQGGCGFLGYDAGVKGKPVRHPGKEVFVTCGGYPGTPFRIAKKAC